MSKGHSRIPIFSGSPKEYHWPHSGFMTIGPSMIYSTLFKRVTLTWLLLCILRRRVKLPTILTLLWSQIQENHGEMNPIPITSTEVAASHLSVNPQYGTWEQWGRDISFEELESESFSCNMEEEVFGIITMEGALEELLQEDIVDETDHSIDLHGKIKINLQASRRSSSASFSSTCSHQWKTPEVQSSLFSVSPIHFAPSFSNTQPPAIGQAASAATTPIPFSRRSDQNVFSVIQNRQSV